MYFQSLNKEEVLKRCSVHSDALVVRLLTEILLSRESSGISSTIQRVLTEPRNYSMFQKYWITSCDGCHFRPNGPIDTKFGEGVHEGLN